MKIRWSPEAADDLQRICERIEIENPEAATRVAGTIYVGCDRLKEFPRVGRTSRRMPGWRELVFQPLPYIVVYLVTEEAVEIPASFTAHRTGHKWLTLTGELRRGGEIAGSGFPSRGCGSWQSRPSRGAAPSVHDGDNP
jgi:toxin ParE1/3/4